MENISLNLPYEISNQLIMKVRENAQEVIEVLKKNHIFQKNSVNYKK